MSKVGEAPSETHSTPALMNQTTFPEEADLSGGSLPCLKPIPGSHKEAYCTSEAELAWTAPSQRGQSRPEVTLQVEDRKGRNTHTGETTTSRQSDLRSFPAQSGCQTALKHVT